MLTILAAAASLLGASSPVLVHDAQERDPFTSVDRPARPVVYAREAGDWLQYWLWSPYNGQDRGIVRTGRHQGDWELLQVRVGPGGRPVEAVVGQHSSAERCSWDAVRTRGGHPVLYVANGSHALYFRPGTRDRTWPDPNDEADGRGSRLDPTVVEVSATEPSWMRDPDPWGSSRASWIPAEQSSPPGPAFQGVRWDDPAAFARTARGCATGCDHVGECDGRETGMAAGAVALLGVSLAAAIRRRRGRSRRRRARAR